MDEVIKCSACSWRHTPILYIDCWRNWNKIYRSCFITVRTGKLRTKIEILFLTKYFIPLRRSSFSFDFVLHSRIGTDSLMSKLSFLRFRLNRDKVEPTLLTTINITIVNDFRFRINIFCNKFVFVEFLYWNLNQ